MSFLSSISHGHWNRPQTLVWMNHNDLLCHWNDANWIVGKSSHEWFRFVDYCNLHRLCIISNSCNSGLVIWLLIIPSWLWFYNVQHNHIFDCNFIAHLGINNIVFMGYALLLLTLHGDFSGSLPGCEILVLKARMQNPINWWMTIATTVSDQMVHPISGPYPISISHDIWLIFHGFYSSPWILPRSSNENLEFISSSIPSGAMRYAALGLDVMSSIRGVETRDFTGWSPVSPLRFTSLYLAKWP